MEIINLDKIKLVSINQKYLLSRGKLILSSAYRNFKNYLIALSIPFRGKIAAKKYAVFIDVKTAKDIDSSIKCVLDGVFDGIDVNDKNINYLVVRKEECKRSDDEKLRVYVQANENMEKIF
jgi:hypothetical protein